MGTTRQALINDTSVVVMLYMALELSASKWKVAIADGQRAPSQHTLSAGDVGALLLLIDKAKKRCVLQGMVKVNSCYEAGRDGFWLHRWLLEQGIDNVVVDSSSIEVNRRARRAKSDALDVGKLYEMLVRYVAGEKRVWRALRVPSVQQEDERRLHRELERLKRERNAHVNRIRSLAVLHKVRLVGVGGRGWSERLEQLKEQLPAGLLAEIERESVREQLVGEQIGALEKSRKEQVQRMGEQGGALTALLKLRAIGVQTAWVLQRELFSWRRFNNRRELAGCVGLNPTPYDSGASQREQGISKAGNRRVRGAAGGDCVVLAALPAAQRAQCLVQPALWARWQAHASHRHSGPCPPPADRSVALCRAGRHPRGGAVEETIAAQGHVARQQHSSY